MLKKDEDRGFVLTVEDDGTMSVLCTCKTGVNEFIGFTYQFNASDVKQLFDELSKHFSGETAEQVDEEPTLPEEPEEKGLYVTQNGILLLKDDDGDWSYKKSPYVENAYFESGYAFITYADNWEHVVKTIGVDAFPLKRIDKSDVIALAKSNNEK